MKKNPRLILLLVLVLALTSAASHKFYVGIFQVNYASDKKMLQVTTRIFVDDLNAALEKKLGHKFHLGEKNETPEDIAQMTKYLTDNFSIKVNGKLRPLEYRSSELENNVFICYFSAKDVPKITAMTVRNKILFDYVTDQQNIIQTTVAGQKNNLLLTIDNPEGTLQVK
jgi:uncharacterized protein DUF6702